MNKQGVTGKEGEEDEWVRKQVRDSLVEKGQPPLEVGGTTNTGINATTTTSSVVNTPLAEIVTPAMYWSNQRAAEAEDYICETVYGGVDGLAYVRSLAEFVAPSQKDYPVCYFFLLAGLFPYSKTCFMRSISGLCCRYMRPVTPILVCRLPDG